MEIKKLGPLAAEVSKVDLKNLLMIHSDFKEIKFKSQDIISYKYTNT